LRSAVGDFPRATFQLIRPRGSDIIRGLFQAGQEFFGDPGAFATRQSQRFGEKFVC
jgi:hypothetical protein